MSDKETYIHLGHTVDDEGDPRGDVHTYRMALWSAHFGGFDEAFLNPNTDECREKGKYDFNLFSTIILLAFWIWLSCHRFQVLYTNLFSSSKRSIARILGIVYSR